MNCPQVPESLANHFDDSLSPVARQKHQQHLVGCSECRMEIAALKGVPAALQSWRSQSVPDWNRSAIMRPHTARKTLSGHPARWSFVGRWAPLAASLLLAVAVVMQTRVEVSDSGWSLSFGGSNPMLDHEQLSAYLATFAEAQQEETRQWVDAALRSHGESTADSVYQWMTWMEQQREQDVRQMEAGFRQLLDRDFQTVDSVRQLASYMMYQENP